VGDGGVDRGAGGSAGRATGGTAGRGSGGSAAGGAVVDPTVDGGPIGECKGPTSYANLFVTVSGHTQAESDDKVSKAWSTLFNPSGSGTIYYDGPGSDESYVKDIYNGDVRTEGMSYGMTIAVQLDHQKEFDRIWTWVRNHMAKGCSGDTCTGEIAWSCPTSGNCNNGGAPDGEEYFATALIFAHTRWGDTGKIKYATEAQWVLNLIRTKYFHTSPNIVKFGSNSGVTDPSYVLPAFYQAWACFDTANAAFWNTAVTDGRAFFHNDVDGNGVCPYQANWNGSQTAGANSDSVRCVMNIMMDYNFFKADSWQSQTYAPKFAGHEKNAGPPSSYCDATLGFGLPASDGKAFVDKIWSANVPSHDYWNGVLYMLSLLHVSGNFKLYY
jgi:oligosaccharide reducing-end xylanase